MAVLEVRTASKVDVLVQQLLRAPSVRALATPEIPVEFVLCTSRVSEQLEASNTDGNIALTAFLLSQLLEAQCKVLNPRAAHALTEVFDSCCSLQAPQAQPPAGSAPPTTPAPQYASMELISNPSPHNLLGAFIRASKPSKEAFSDHVNTLLATYGITKPAE